MCSKQNESKLFTKETVYQWTPAWFQREYTTYREIVTRPDFPCTFGIAGEKKGEFRYSYILHDDWSHIPNTLRAFQKLFDQSEPLTRHVLFLFVEPETEEKPLEYYYTYFWDVLQYLHDNDEKPWPTSYPIDPEHHLWTFCFNQNPYFAFGNAPTYKKRKARNLGNTLIIGFQPRIIFEGLDGTTEVGVRSREAIRKRVEKWEGLPKHPNIDYYGDENHREWKQFFIGDDVAPIQGKCPFNYEK